MSAADIVGCVASVAAVAVAVGWSIRTRREIRRWRR